MLVALLVVFMLWEILNVAYIETIGVYKNIYIAYKVGVPGFKSLHKGCLNRRTYKTIMAFDKSYGVFVFIALFISDLRWCAISIILVGIASAVAIKFSELKGDIYEKSLGRHMTITMLDSTLCAIIMWIAILQLVR